MNVFTRDFSDWYWLVADHASSGVFSSKRNAYVPLTDGIYQAWLDSGAQPINIDTETNLAEVLAFRLHGYVMNSIVGLTAYANAKQTQIAQGGFTVAAATNVLVNVDTDPISSTYLSAAVQLVSVKSSTIINWVQRDGSIVPLDNVEMITVGVNVGSLVQGTFTTLGQVLSAIADGRITTQAGIDNPPSGVAPWPQNS